MESFEYRRHHFILVIVWFIKGASFIGTAFIGGLEFQFWFAFVTSSKLPTAYVQRNHNYNQNLMFEFRLYSLYAPNEWLSL